eukprot:3902407-Rhodomonas_salina.3
MSVSTSHVRSKHVGRPATGGFRTWPSHWTACQLSLVLLRVRRHTLCQSLSSTLFTLRTRTRQSDPARPRAAVPRCSNGKWTRRVQVRETCGGGCSTGGVECDGWIRQCVEWQV